MAMLVYTTGNGYHCGCCRQTSQDYTYFDSDDIQSLIKECVEIARGSEWDFYVNTIEGYSGEDDLEQVIETAIKQAEADADRKRKIDDLTRQITSINNWFANLERTKDEKMAEREKLIDKLKTMES